MEVEEITELLKHFQRDINCLVEEDRNLKKKGLTSIMNDLFKSDVPPFASLEIFQKYVLKYLVKLFDDKIEKHREFVLKILEKYFATLAANKQHSDKECLEIILRGLLQREAAHLIVVSSEKLRKLLGFHSSGVLKGLAINSGHQHSRVRKATLEAMGALILAEGAGANLELIYPSLKILVNDKSTDVRKTSLECIAKIVNGFSLSNLRDSESKLIYLLLTGLSDENEEIVKTSINLIEEVGEKRQLLGLEFGENDLKS